MFVMVDFQLSDDFVKIAVTTWQDVCEQGFVIRAAVQWINTLIGVKFS
jgi:hypothetical protein